MSILDDIHAFPQKFSSTKIRKTYEQQDYLLKPCVYNQKQKPYLITFSKYLDIPKKSHKHAKSDI